MTNEELPLEEQVARIRRRRQRRDFSRMRAILISLVLIIAAVGLLLYFTDMVAHPVALGVIAVGMTLKTVEFVLRFL